MPKMATYKVLQDIEAEDKLFGPLTLKQFIFAAIAIFLVYIEFRILIAGMPIFIKFPFFMVLLPPLLVFGFMAAPIGRDQPNDIWLLARLRFLFKPRTRIWNQDGLSELVSINVPKKEIRNFSNNFSQEEVKSRLNALASTMDTRGWAVKSADANIYATPSYLTDTTNSDRLVDPASSPTEVPALDIRAEDDILDPSSNQTAQNLDRLIKQSSSKAKTQAKTQMSGGSTKQTPTPRDYYFMNQPQTPAMPLPQDYATFSSQKVVNPGTDDSADAVVETEEEKALAHKVVEEKAKIIEHQNDHMKVIDPSGKSSKVAKTSDEAKMPDDKRQTPANPAIIGLAQNDDLDVATIARQAQKINGSKDDGEVVISLH